MNNNVKNICTVLIWVIIAYIVTLCIIKIKPKEVPERILTETDTLYVYDTLKYEKVIYKDKIVVDTVYMIYRDTVNVPIPISSYHFSKDSIFDLHIKGYEVTLEDITIYPQRDIVTIKDVLYKESNLSRYYLGVNLGVFNGAVVPSINFSFQTQNRLLYGVNLGYYNNSLFIGGNISYQIK